MRSAPPDTLRVFDRICHAVRVARDQPLELRDMVTAHHLAGVLTSERPDPEDVGQLLELLGLEPTVLQSLTR